MRNCKGLSFVLNYKKTSTYALNVIVGAIESSSELADIEVLFSKDLESLVVTTLDALERDRHVVIAWSFYSPNFIESSNELRQFKEKVSNTNIIHIAGGVHATAEPEQTLRAGFDFAAIGEGEKTIVDFLIKLINKENPSSVKGIAHLSDGVFKSNGSGILVDINDYPPFAPKNGKFNPIEITRGCIYACKFCQTPFMFKARFRHRTVENICHYVQMMKERGLKDVRFISPTSLSYGSPDDSVNLEKIEELLSSVRSIIGTQGRVFFGTFPSEVRPEHVSLEALSILKKYVNNDNLIIGAQAGSQRVLDWSHRGHNVEVIGRAVRLALEAGFLPNVDFIFGLPGETSFDVQDSLTLAEKLTEMGARIHGHTFMPLPGTPFKDAPPGKMNRSTFKKLKRLESRGGLYGQWKKQISIAESLAVVRDSSPSKRKKKKYADTKT
jgi:B12-binding domain/radical SAM domain protein